jgi:hypothetical protein
MESIKDKIKEDEDELIINEEENDDIKDEIKKVDNDNKIELLKIPPGTPRDKFGEYVDPMLLDMYEKQLKKLNDDKIKYDDVIKQLKKNLSGNRKKLTKKINKLSSWIPINVDDVEKDIATLSSDISAQRVVVDGVEGDINLLKENLELNKKKFQEHRNEIKQISRNYEEGMKQANPNRLNLQQQPNETPEDYITRIKNIEEEKFDINIHGDKSELNNIRKLKAKLKYIIRDPTSIEHVIKSFTPEEICKINQYFEVIKSKFLH